MSKVIKEMEDKDLLKMLADGVKAVMTYGEFGRVSPSGAMIGDIYG